MSLARAERAALSDTLEKTDPGQPTLCAGWTAHDLLAHLLVRERQPWASGGIAIPLLAPLTQQAMRGYADTPWQQMVDELRSGPPAWSPYRINRVDEAANGAELFVHHEDVRRGLPGWEPREYDETRDAALWSLVRRSGRWLYRRSPVGIVVRRPVGEQAVVKTGTGLVTVDGEPGEILLHAFGREAARVDLRGEPADVAAFEAAPRGA
jgi:uncharacterized protein (TIGR03085 family)